MRSTLSILTAGITRAPKRSCFLLCLTVIAILAGSVSAKTSARDAINAANNAYEQGDYRSAVEGYREALKSGLDNGHLRYNLANAHYRLEDYGQAIANYRRALELLPGNSDVSANLALARKQIGRAEEQPQSIFNTVLSAPFQVATEAELELALIVFYSLFFLSIAASPFLKTEPKRMRTFRNSFLGITLFLSFLVFGTKPGRLGGRELALTPSAHAVQPGVVVTEKTEVRSGNGENFQVVFMLHEGAEVETREVRDDWIEVLLPQGRRGWLNAAAVEII